MRPPDIGAALFANCGALVLEGSSASHRVKPMLVPDETFVATRTDTKVTYIRRRLKNTCRVVDFGDKVVLVGRTTDVEIHKALQLLAMRGAEVVSGSGFSKREILRAQKIAKDFGMTVIPRPEAPSNLQLANRPNVAEHIKDVEADEVARPKNQSVLARDTLRGGEIER
jgi:hypothetical protein|tara:strand:+ start:87 stop:593 length:507 start_codon:yes stop_codon:yes gene_type:complete